MRSRTASTTRRSRRHLVTTVLVATVVTGLALLALPHVAAAHTLSLDTVEYLAEDQLVEGDAAVFEELEWCRGRTAHRVDCRVNGMNDEGRSWSRAYRWVLRDGRLFLGVDRQRAVPFIAGGGALGSGVYVDLAFGTKSGQFVPRRVTGVRTKVVLRCSDGSAERPVWDPLWDARIGRDGTFTDTRTESFEPEPDEPDEPAYPRTQRATLTGRRITRKVTGTLRVVETYAEKTCDSGAVFFNARIEPLPGFISSGPRFRG